MKTRIKFLSVNEFDGILSFSMEMNGELYRTNLHSIWVPNLRGVWDSDTSFEGVEIETEIKEYQPHYNGSIFFFTDEATNILTLIAGDLAELKRDSKAKITQNIEAVTKDAPTYREAMQNAETESEWRGITRGIKERIIEGLSPFLLEAEKYRLFWECIDEYCIKKYGVRCYKTLSEEHLKRDGNEKYIDITFPYQIINFEKEIIAKAEQERILATYEIGKFHISQDPRGGENGRDGFYKFDVLDKTDGKIYIFIWRDVFDFGSWGFPFRKGIDQFKEETWTGKERDIYKFVRSKFPGGVRM